jgi:acyl dehydratase
MLQYVYAILIFMGGIEQPSIWRIPQTWQHETAGRSSAGLARILPDGEGQQQMRKWFFDDIPLNQPRTTGEYVVPEEELIAFARQWDPLAMHTDREAAKKSPHGGIIAPAMYTMAVANALIDELDPSIQSIGGAEWKVQFPQPVRPGDRLVAASECVYKRDSRTKPDRGIARFVISMRNQRRETVLQWECTVVVARGQAAD